MARVVLRDSAQHERAATPLELLFDLCFVVAIALLAKDLHYGISEGRWEQAAAAYALLFVPVWWAWMSFTWFATAFDNDDTVHRLLTMAQMLGIVALASTVHAAYDGDLAAFGWALVVVRAPLVVQWLRAAAHDPAHAAFARTYALGLTIGAIGWWAGTRLEAPVAIVALAPVLVVDLATPMLAVRRAPGPIFHPGHIGERYGLFTLIVIGESILAMTVAVESAATGEAGATDLAGIVLGAAALAFGAWWIYFGALGRDGLTRNRRAAFGWGYGHYLLFAALAAVGAGVQVQVDAAVGYGDDPPDIALGLAATAWPGAVVLIAVALLQVMVNRRAGQALPLLAGAAVLLVVPSVGGTLAAGALVAVAVTAVATAVNRASGAGEPRP